MAEERIQALKRRTASRIRQAGLLFCSSILLTGILWRNRSDAAAIVTRSEGTWTREMNRLRSIRDTKTKDSQFRSAVAGTLRRAFDTPQPLSDVVAVVGDSMPEGAWMTGLNLERGKLLQVRGTAKTADEVAKLVEKLGTLPRFRDVRLVFANSAKIDDQPVVQFSVTARAVGNLPLPTQERKTRAKKPTTPSTEQTGSAQ
jgi:hypothetical protein